MIQPLRSFIVASAIMILASPSFADDNVLCGPGPMTETFSNQEDKSSEMTSESESDSESAFSTKSAFQSCLYSLYGGGISFLDPEGTSNGWRSEDNLSFGASIGVGWDISNHWFTELRYTYIGRAALENDNPVVDNAVDAAIKYQAPSLMIGRKLFENSPNFNAYVKVGASWIHNKETDESVIYDEVSKLQASLGTGLRFYLKDSPWFVDVVYDAFSKDANLVGVQFGRYFGHTKEVPVETPEVVYVPPKPDADRDGVPDEIDRCPFTNAGTKVGEYGCCLPKDGCQVTFPEH